MTRARDNADKLSGGEIIKLETDEINECNESFYGVQPRGISVRDSFDRCVFSIGQDGKLFQSWIPPGETTYENSGVMLLSDKAGIRVLRGPVMEITKDGGQTWHYCCGEYPEPPPPPIPPPPQQSGFVTFTKIEARWKDAIGTNYKTYTPETGYAQNPRIKWGTYHYLPESNRSQYDYFCRSTDFTEEPLTSFSFGNFIHTNFPTPGGTIDEVYLELSVDLKITYREVLYEESDTTTEYDFIGVIFNFKFNHDETPNTAKPCKYAGDNYQGVNLNGCADKVDITPVGTNENVLTFDKGSIQLSLLGFALTEDEADAGVVITDWLTAEEKENQAVLVGQYSIAFNPIDVGDMPIEVPDAPSVPAELPPGVSPSDKLGELEDGTPVTVCEELNGHILDAVYVPTYANPTNIIYPAGGREVIYPACAGQPSNTLGEFTDCKNSTESLKPNITISQRLPIIDTRPEPRVEMKTRDTMDELRNYDFSISSYPGDLDSEDGCSSKNLDASTFYFLPEDGYCSFPLNNIGDGKLKMYYANFRPSGSDAYKCNDSLICAMYVRAWMTPPFDGSGPPYDAEYPVDPEPCDDGSNVPPGVDPTEKLGELEDGTAVTVCEELNGYIHDTVYVPTYANPTNIIFPCGGSDVPYPGGAGENIGSVPDFWEKLYAVCTDHDKMPKYATCLDGRMSLLPGITFSQRLPVINSLPSRVVSGFTTETNDILANYDFSVSDYPGDLDSDNGCFIKNTYQAYFYFYDIGNYCKLPLDNIGNGKIKMYYFNFKPAGPDAHKCGDSVNCSVRVHGWITPPFDGGGPPYDAEYPVDPEPCDDGSNVPPGVDPTEKLGELEDGTPVTYEQEYSGELHDRVYIPTAANPKTIICSIGRPETIQPGCCSREPDPLITKCAEEGQPGYGTDFPYDTTWCVRLPFNSDASNPFYPRPVIYFYTRETGDELGTYNLSVSRNPGDFNVPDTDKKMNTPTWSCYFYTGDDWQAGEGAKPYSLQELGTPGQKMIYVNVQPTGSSASKCGSLIYNNPDGSIACRMYIAAWPSTSNPNDLPDLEDPRSPDG